MVAAHGFNSRKFYDTFVEQEGFIGISPKVDDFFPDHIHRAFISAKVVYDTDPGAKWEHMGVAMLLRRKVPVADQKTLITNTIMTMLNKKTVYETKSCLWTASPSTPSTSGFQHTWMPSRTPPRS